MTTSDPREPASTPQPEPTSKKSTKSKKSTAPAPVVGTPSRFDAPPVFGWIAGVFFLALLIHGWTQGAKVDFSEFGSGLSNLGRFLAEAFPPDVDRLGSILKSLLTTFEMALLGTILGVIASVPLGLAAARNVAPPLLYGAARLLITIARTIPDMVWGLIFVIAVGLGPEAGVLALAVDTLGFCGRFFAEAFEEVDEGPRMALRASGAPSVAQVVGGILPDAQPSMIATSLFSLEQATRSSVVLGLVGAGGIGVELSTSMALLRYDEAMTIILCIFVVVLAVERFSSFLRGRVMGVAM